MPFRRVVVAVDGSPTSLAALEATAELAAVWGAEVVGLFVEDASLLKMAQTLGLELLLSISDRETAITYYVLKRVVLPGSGYEYYEIEWMKP